MRSCRHFGILASLCLLTGLVAEGRSGQEEPGGASPEAPHPPRRLATPGIENGFRLAPGLFSGGEPEGEEGFETLKQLGVRTIISVDGAAPDVETARRHGMRYVHLPVGYDGIPADQAARLVKAIRERPGPVFVHCHHGKHRGPAAAASCAWATEAREPATARAWLEQAGTDPGYKGLYAAVDRFAPPTAEELAEIAPEELPERATVPDLVESMVEIDRIWSRIEATQGAL